LTTAIKPNQYIGMQLLDWSMTARKVAVTAAKTMSKSKTVSEMTATSLDARREIRLTTPMMHSSCNDGVIQLSHSQFFNGA